jgi:type I restriction enzyme M protein
VLSGEIQAVYKLTKGEKHSDLERVDEEPEMDGFDLVITNPPYSLKHEWQQVPPYCEGYGTPPTKAADYAFILYGLSRMATTGKLCAILPHGVLFRGQREAEIRQKLITENRLESVIGLPDKLFLNTDIPICIIVLRDGTENTLFIDASKEYLKESKKNRLRAEDVEKITDTFRKKATVAKYSKLVNLTEIESNDYNCNISIYVDTFEKKPLPNIGQVTEDLIRIDKEIRKTELELAKALEGMVGSEEDTALIRKYIRHLRKGGEKYEQITFNL